MGDGTWGETVTESETGERVFSIDRYKIGRHATGLARVRDRGREIDRTHE